MEQKYSRKSLLLIGIWIIDWYLLRPYYTVGATNLLFVQPLDWDQDVEILHTQRFEKFFGIKMLKYCTHKDLKSSSQCNTPVVLPSNYTYSAILGHL
jgi:hypothetical protein